MEAGTSAPKRKRVVRTRRETNQEEQVQEIPGIRSESEHEELQESRASESESEDEQVGVQLNVPGVSGNPAAPMPASTKELKIKMPEFKGKKGDPQVHLQAFKSWATLRELPRMEWKLCFPQTLRGAAQKWYFNYPPEKLTTFKAMGKALVQRFTDEKTDEELLSQLGRIKQKKNNVRHFVEEIKDLTRQLTSPPGNKSLRAWFLNGTSLKELAKAEITNPTKGFEELVQRAIKMERKGRKKARTSSSSESSSSSKESSDSDKGPISKKAKQWET